MLEAVELAAAHHPAAGHLAPALGDHGALPLLVVRQLDEHGEPSGGYVVAVDSVGAGVGEIVLYASGSSARQTQVTRDRPCDAVIMAIVDQWDLDGETVYVK